VGVMLVAGIGVLYQVVAVVTLGSISRDRPCATYSLELLGGRDDDDVTP
jgi:hypothetical protein